MNEELASIVRGTAGLAVAAVAALWLAWSRPPRSGASVEADRVRRVAAVVIAMQTVHFVEEWHTGFHVRFPALLGLTPWSSAFFVAFNVGWLAIWLFSTAFLRAHPQLLSFPLWFLAIASVANGVVHPLASVMTDGYFPGLWSSPFVGALGVVLLRTLGAFRRRERL